MQHMNMEVKSELELMQDFLAEYRSLKPSDIFRKTEILLELEYLVHQAIDFPRITLIF